MKERSKRYEKVKDSPGIRKDLFTGHYEAYKNLKNIRYSATFTNLKDARMWRLTYVPMEEKALKLKMTLRELIELYIKEYMPLLATSTRLTRLDRLKIFYDEKFINLEVEKLSPEIIKQFFQKKANQAKANGSRRMNFDGEIKDLRAILNWYRETYNYKYVVPIIAKRLKASCTLTKEKKVKEKLTAEEFLKFFNALDPFYRDVALVQSRMAGRISEVAGIQFKSVDFKNRTLLVKDIVVYGRRKEFVELKSNPKNGDIRSCFITDNLMEVLQRRLALKSPKSDFVFHINGDPIKYRSVQHAYDHALKKAGLIHKTSGTHMLRHFTASLTRYVCGSLDSVQSVTGHKSLKMVEHYGGIASTLQTESISKVEAYLKQKAQESEHLCASYVQTTSEENFEIDDCSNVLNFKTKKKGIA